MVGPEVDYYLKREATPPKKNLREKRSSEKQSDGVLVGFLFHFLNGCLGTSQYLSDFWP